MHFTSRWQNFGGIGIRISWSRLGFGLCGLRLFRLRFAGICFFGRGKQTDFDGLLQNERSEEANGRQMSLRSQVTKYGLYAATQIFLTLTISHNSLLLSKFFRICIYFKSLSPNR